MKKSTVLAIVIPVTAAGLIAGTVGAVTLSQTLASPAATPTVAVETTPSAAPLPSNAEEAAAENPATTAEMLAFIIEEEKLAFDVYTVLGEMWNSNTMLNIVNSESSHQSQVEGLLATYGVADPRSSEVGVFTNPDLQALYDQLIAQGSVSKQAAMEVGVLIEETDIADIDEMLGVITEPDIVSVLQSLRSGSENHLAAFQRQL